MSELHPRTYWTSDRSALIEEGDERAAFLAYGPWDPIPPEHRELLQTRASVVSDEIEHDLYGSEDDKPAPESTPSPTPKRATRKPKG